MTGDSFRIGCELIRLHDADREMRQAGLPTPGSLTRAIGEKTAEWDAARGADMTRLPASYPRLAPIWHRAAA